MKKNRLGKTDLYVTELCFGALPFGPLQKNMPVDECTEILSEALKAGINFIDTAQMYLTYKPIRRAMEATAFDPSLLPNQPQVHTRICRRPWKMP